MGTIDIQPTAPSLGGVGVILTDEGYHNDADISGTSIKLFVMLITYIIIRLR